MDRKRVFNIITIILVSIIILIGIYKIILKNINLNQGKFILNDAIISYKTEVISKTEENNYLSFDASQNNMLSLQIVPLGNVEIEEMYIDNVAVNKYNSNIYINQKDREETLAQDIQKLPIEIQYQQNRSILIEIEITNKNLVVNKTLPNNIQELRYDGKVLKDIGLNIADIQFDIKFTLNIIDKEGTKNIMKINRKLPKQEMLDNGYYVERMNKSEVMFKVN